MRILANAICRAPIWSESIEKNSKIDQTDPYAEPRCGTSVGWGGSILAGQRGEYPNDPKARTEGWRGELDSRLHAAAWLKDPSIGQRLAVRRA
jgi:hypothetical protein